MNRRKIIVFGAILFVAGVGPAPASAQTFQNYRCADGTQFIVGFFEYDKRAHIQIDGKAVTLAKRLELSGSQYSRAGGTLQITSESTTVKNDMRPATEPSPSMPHSGLSREPPGPRQGIGRSWRTPDSNSYSSSISITSSAGTHAAPDSFSTGY